MTPNTKALIADISKSCYPCQKFSRKPISFQIRDREDLRFNQEIMLDLMWLDGKPVLHIIDAGTNFSAARILPAEDSATVWNTFLKAWAHLYIVFPESMLVDQGSVFLSDEWEGPCHSSQIELRKIGFRSNNSLGAGETYHSMLRKIFNKEKMDHPVVQREWPIRSRQLALFIVLSLLRSHWLAAILHRCYWLDTICVLAQWALACNQLTGASGQASCP